MSPRLSAAVLLSVALLAALPAQAALARRDQAAVDALQQRLQAAEKQYREAQLAEDPQAGSASATAALAEIKAVVEACSRQRGCEVAPMLAVYDRLLQATAKEEADPDDPDGDRIDERDLADAEVPAKADAAALLGEDGQKFVQMVQFNPAVQAGIRRWLTDLRPSLMDSYENYQYLKEQMSPAFRKRGLPEALLFGILAKESNGKVHVASRAGAVGPLQFMPATGRRFGLGNDGSGFDTRYDPRAAADAAAQYLSERLAELGNSIELSLAGYNGGEGRALRVYQSSGGRSFWDLDVYNQFPAETKDYVPMVIAAAWLFLHPREYGIVWPRVYSRNATIQLARPTSLYELTICLGNAGSRDGYLRALRNLNPRWDPTSTIPAGTPLAATAWIARLYERHCLRGERLQLAQQLLASNVQAALVRVGDPVPANAAQGPAADPPAAPAPAAPRPAPVPRMHKVRRGETLQGIARQWRCDLDDLARANKLRKPKYAIKPGQALKLVGCG